MWVIRSHAFGMRILFIPHRENSGHSWLLTLSSPSKEFSYPVKPNQFFHASIITQTRLGEFKALLTKLVISTLVVFPPQSRNSYQLSQCNSFLILRSQAWLLGAVHNLIFYRVGSDTVYEAFAGKGHQMISNHIACAVFLNICIFCAKTTRNTSGLTFPISSLPSCVAHRITQFDSAQSLRCVIWRPPSLMTTDAFPHTAATIDFRWIYGFHCLQGVDIHPIWDSIPRFLRDCRVH